MCADLRNTHYELLTTEKQKQNVLKFCMCILSFHCLYSIYICDISLLILVFNDQDLMTVTYILTKIDSVTPHLQYITWYMISFFVP